MRACGRVRSTLVESGRSGLPSEMRAHVAGCPACARFAERAEAAHGVLRDHRADFEPDATFATRVSVRLNGAAPELMGRIALRLLPAALALVAVLAFAAFRDGSGTGPVVSADTTDDLVQWVLDADEGA